MALAPDGLSSLPTPARIWLVQAKAFRLDRNLFQEDTGLRLRRTTSNPSLAMQQNVRQARVLDAQARVSASEVQVRVE